MARCGCAACLARRCTGDSRWVSIQWHAPIASVAALTAQPLAALPPYGCGVPFTGVERLVQENSTAGGHWCTTAPPDVSLRGAKRRGNLAVLGRITGRSRRKRSCLPEIATAPSGPRNDKSEGIAPLNLCRDHCQSARRSLSAATGPVGAVSHFNDSLFPAQVQRRERHAPPLQRAADARIIQQKQGRTGLGASLFFQLLIPPPAWACRGAYTWSSSRRGGCSHSRCSGTGGRRAACAARRPCTPGRSRAARRPS